MRRPTLFILSMAAALSVNAKDLRHAAHAGKTKTGITKGNAADIRITPLDRKHPLAKGTAATFSAEHFDTGLDGWTVGTASGNGTWKWFPHGHVSGSEFAIEAINTTTGFMIYDSDTIGTASPGVNPVGWMKSTAMDCSAHTSVALTFNEYYEHYNDSCFVDVSTDANFGTYTRYAVHANNNMNSNDFVPSNPYNVFINITPAAAGHASVYLRFYYYGPIDGGYSWQVDDVSLSELDPVNVALHGSYLYSDSTVASPYGSSIGNVPSQFRDSVTPITLLDNRGAMAQSGFTINAKIYKNGVLTGYDRTQTVTAFPLSTEDSIFQFPKYFADPVSIPGGTDLYFCAFSSAVTGNTNVDNLVDTVRFSVTDTLWSQSTNTIVGSFNVHRPVNQGELSRYLGTRFDVPAGAADTLTGVSVAFGYGTTEGTPVQVQIYKLDTPATSPTAGWTIKYVCFPQDIGPGQISTQTSIVYKLFPMQLDSAYPILTEGTWAAVITTINATPSASVTIVSSAPNPATPYAGYFGQEYASANDGSFKFGFHDQATDFNMIPLVRLHLATNHALLNTQKLMSALNIGRVYPNPASNSVNIPFTISEDANVNLSITNTMGQVIKSRALGHVAAGTSRTVTFSTTDMAAGVYFYSIEVNGTRTTNRFVVGH